MARLRVQIEKPAQGAVVGTAQVWTGRPIAEQEQDDRPKTTATERMYWRRTGVLAYLAGEEFPTEIGEQLAGDDEWQRHLRGEVEAPRSRRKA